jgi:hypothetical protein
VITRYGGETVGAVQPISPHVIARRLPLVRSVEECAIAEVYGVDNDVSGVTLSPDNSDSFTSVGAIPEYDNRPKEFLIPNS